MTGNSIVNDFFNCVVYFCTVFTLSTEPYVHVFFLQIEMLSLLNMKYNFTSTYFLPIGLFEIGEYFTKRIGWAFSLNVH